MLLLALRLSNSAPKPPTRRYSEIHSNVTVDTTVNRRQEEDQPDLISFSNAEVIQEPPKVEDTAHSNFVQLVDQMHSLRAKQLSEGGFRSQSLSPAAYSWQLVPYNLNQSAASLSAQPYHPIQGPVNPFQYPDHAIQKPVNSSAPLTPEQLTKLYNMNAYPQAGPSHQPSPPIYTGYYPYPASHSQTPTLPPRPTTPANIGFVANPESALVLVPKTTTQETPHQPPVLPKTTATYAPPRNLKKPMDDLIDLGSGLDNKSIDKFVNLQISPLGRSSNCISFCFFFRVSVLEAFDPLLSDETGFDKGKNPKIHF